MIHPIMKGLVFCAEHRAAEGGDVGDALGADCLLARRDSAAGTAAPLSFHRAGGLRNSDWFGWGATLLAPFDGVVESVHSNPASNAIGVMKAERPGMIVFLRADSVRVVFAHVGRIDVRPGQKLRAGDPVGQVGNNGRSRNPHTHVGAWKGDAPLQVRFDLAVPTG